MNVLYGDYTNPTRRGINHILQNFGGISTAYNPNPISVEAVGTDIYDFRPIVILLYHGANSGHYIICHGVSDFNSHDSTPMYIMDPVQGAIITYYGEVMDDGINQWGETLQMESAPSAFMMSNPSPENSYTNVPMDSGLSWHNIEGAQTIKVNFDTATPPATIVYQGAVRASLSSGMLGRNLNSYTTYYWQVNTTIDGIEHPGPIWNFTTAVGNSYYQPGGGTLTNTNTTYPTPYGNQYWGAKHQFLIQADELRGSGMLTWGEIQGIGFEVVTPQGTPLSNFTIKAGTTTYSYLNNWIPNLTTVWGPASHTESGGWNYYNFTVPINWDGNENLVIQTCFNNTSATHNAIVKQKATSGYTTSLYYYANNTSVASSTNISGSAQQRPNIRVKYEPHLQQVGPINLVKSNFGIILTWNPVNNANSYRIYASDNPYTANWGLPIGNVSYPVFGDNFGSNAPPRRYYRIIASTQPPEW